MIAGLGNPGRRYKNTRHNIGFTVVEALSELLKIEFIEKGLYHICKGIYKDKKIVLIKPTVYMNLSGLAVEEVLRKSNGSSEELMVVHDDIDLPVGKIKIKKKGSSGGHKGVQSIIEDIGTNEFIRIKIGIGKPIGVIPEVYVLEKFPSDEKGIIKDSIKNAIEAVLDVIEKGVDHAMNKYNRIQ